MHILHQFLDTILHLDAHLNLWFAAFGPYAYVILFLILFAETGLVVCPILPGDSLLFALGALSASENSSVSLPILLVLLPVAVLLGDVTNYSIGRYLGEHLFRDPNSKFFRREYLDRTKTFYAKHGARAIVIARFIPIVRTFAPFVAGMAGMKYPRFILFSVSGSLAWIFSFLLAGHFFGNLPAVKTNFHFVILAILVISVLPIVFEWLKAKNAKAHTV
jgi:membrane-associated protein